MARNLTVLFLLCLIAMPAYGQFYSTQYRVPGQNWMQVQTEHFNIIFPERYGEQAWRSLAILESDLDGMRDLVGGNIRHFPFILNPENDLSNGFVSPLNFRSEVEISPIIGKTMNPRSGNWMELVLPHELAHVMHFSVNPNSLTRLLGIFSPDARRSIHSAAPLGVFEGLAVHHESHGSIPYAGRGNHSYFRNQFNALLDTRREWSMGQLLHTSDYTPPFDRHYIGGYEFTHWLLHTYGEDAMKKSIAFHYRYPFLGFGTALRRTTGHWPARLYRQFAEQRQQSEQLRRSLLETDTNNLSEEVPFSARCQRMNRPRWTDDETLVFHARSCNRATGFYLYNLAENSVQLLREVSIPSDYQYSLTEDRTELVYTRYHAHLLYDNLQRGDLHRLQLATGRSSRITHQMRLFSPEISGSEIFAMQTVADEMRLVSVDSQTGQLLREFAMPKHTSAVQIAVNPHSPGQAAIIGRVKSVQAIWFESINQTDELFTRQPDVVFEEGSVYDISWHPSEERFLFVSDHTGVMNVYEFDMKEQTVTQITESLHNAFEASYSPDGSRIAYIAQKPEEQKLYLLDRTRALNRELEPAEWAFTPLVKKRLNRPLMNREIDPDLFEWEPQPYKTGFGWLKPRYWMPQYERVAGFDRIGANIESGDLMSRQAYSMDVYSYADRFWYNLAYRNQRYYPGFVAELFNQPAFTSLAVQQNEDEENGGDENKEEEEIRVRVLQQARGGSLKVPIRLRLESNARFTSLLFEPQYFISQIRFLDGADKPVALSRFGTRHTVGLRSVLNFRIRQFIRDVQPNSGLVLFAEGRYGLNSDEIRIESDEFSVTGNLTQRKGLRAGAITYLAPLARWNQSLRVSARVYTQTDVPVFNVFSQFSENFSEIPLTEVNANNVGILDMRYTVPLSHPDDGGLLVPLYLSNLYLVFFSQTVSDLNQSALGAASRTVYGAGIRSRFRLSNIAFDVGISIGWEPTRNEVTYYFGSF